MAARTAIPAVFALAATLMAAGSNTALQARPPVQGRIPRPLVARANDTFALALYAQLARQKGNLFFSPSSIHTALTMTYAGAANATAEQMYATLALWPNPKAAPGTPARSPEADTHGIYKLFLEKLQPGPNAGYELTVANALWGQLGYPWNADFLKTTKDAYGAGLIETDFAGSAELARQAINDWVTKQTREKIKDLRKPGMIDPMPRLVLPNAIYFKGTWAEPFQKTATQDAPFHLAAGPDVQAPLMQRTSRFGYVERDGVQARSTPYKGNELSRVVLLPKAPDGLGALEKGLTAVKLDGFLGRLADREVDVYLPRFKATCEFSLADPLKAMGMVDAFDPQKADFSGMNGKRDLFISLVVHKAFVEVNEEGAEAAAATAVNVMPTCMPETPSEPNPVFRADHPFLFLIRHNATGAILFLGRLSDPR
ncbi:MAG: serpin family protein [Planctomycetota bacterium]|nr:serpin family protein [Planctomycetota bacterium]